MAGIGRIYTNQSVLGAGLNGVYEGLKDAEDEKFRQAELATKKSQIKQGADKDAYDRYQKAEFDNKGLYTRAVEDLTRQQNDIGSREKGKETGLAKLMPEVFSTTIQEPKPEVPFSVEDPLGGVDEVARARIDSERLKKGLPTLGGSAGSVAPPPAQAPQQVEKLLKSKEETKRESEERVIREQGGQKYNATIEAGNRPVSIEDKGIDPATGKNLKVVKTNVDAGPDMPIDVKVNPGSPAVPEIREEWNPSGGLLAKLAERATTAQAKDTDPLISMSTIPPEVKKLMGISADFQGSLRSSIVKELIQAGSKTAAGVAIRPQVQEGIDLVREGKSTPAAVARMIPDLTKAESDKLNQAAYQSTSQTGTNTRAEKIATRQERREINGIKRGAQKDMYSAFKGEIDEIQAAKTLRKLAGKKDTAGSEALIATMLLRMSGQASNSISDRDMKSMGGVTGWGNMVEQFAAKVAGEGLTPANKKRALELADIFEKSAKKIVRSKSGFVRRSAISQLESYYDDPSEAEAEIDKALDVDGLLSGFDEDVPQGGKGGQSGLSSEQKLQLKNVATQKLQEINGSSIGAAEKAQKVQKIMQWYAKEAGQQYTSKVE